MTDPLVGQRLADTVMDEGLPDPFKSFEDIPVGGYWKMLNRRDGKPLDVHTLADQRWWNNSGMQDPKFNQNLTGTVWSYKDPNGKYGMMSIHTVREEADGTISVRPGDGSSNSILNTWEVIDRPDLTQTWHGYIEHGVWKEV